MKTKNKKEKLSKEQKKKIKQDNALKKKQENELNKRLKKEANEREKARELEKTKDIIWTYAHDADLTIGEKKISNVAKVILILLIIGLIVGGIFAYLNREFIVDYISKPEIALTTNKATLEVGDKFNYKDYIVKKDYPERYKLTYPDNKSVDTNKLGEYAVEYKLKTSANENLATLTVEVVDTTPPELELTDNIIQLERDKDTKKFDPEKYIKSVSDNYYDEKDIEIEYTNTFDWSKDEVRVMYSATDKSGNISNEELTIIVNDPPKEPEIIYIEKEPEPTPTPEPTPEPNNNNNENNGGSYSGGNQEYYEEPAYTQAPQPTPVPTQAPAPEPQPQQQEQPAAQPQPSEPYINGVHNVTVPIGTDFQSLVNQLIDGVTGSGYISVDYSSINPTIPGVYTATFNSSDGVTKTATVTIVE